MSETIVYNYGANFDSLDAIKAALNDAQELRGDVHTVFNSLADVYQGQAADALQAHHLHVSGKLDQLILDMQVTQQQAVDRQFLTAASDHQMAGNF